MPQRPCLWWHSTTPTQRDCGAAALLVPSSPLPQKPTPCCHPTRVAIHRFIISAVPQFKCFQAGRARMLLSTTLPDASLSSCSCKERWVRGRGGVCRSSGCCEVRQLPCNGSYPTCTASPQAMLPQQRALNLRLRGCRRRSSIPCRRHSDPIPHPNFARRSACHRRMASAIFSRTSGGRLTPILTWDRRYRCTAVTGGGRVTARHRCQPRTAAGKGNRTRMRRQQGSLPRGAPVSSRTQPAHPRALREN